MTDSAPSPAPTTGTLVKFTFPAPAELTDEERDHLDRTGAYPVRVEVPATAATAVEMAKALRGHRLQVATVERVVGEQVAALKNGNLPDPPRFLKKGNYAKRCDYSVRYLDHLIEAGLPTIGSGKALRIPVQEADEWLRELGSPTEGEIESEARLRAHGDRGAR